VNRPKPYSLRKKSSSKQAKSTHSFGKIEIPKDAIVKPTVRID